MKRFYFNPPSDFNRLTIINGSLKESKIIYYVHPILNGGDQDEVLEYMDGPFGSQLHGFLMAIGSYCRLWLGDLDGIITPKDVQPQGWVYGNDEPVEESWFWEWHPSEFSKKKLLGDIAEINPLKNEGRLKMLVPMCLNDKHGKIESVEAIPVMRLPQLFRNCQWIFEIDD